MYGSGKHSYVSTDPEARSGNMEPLFDAILNHIPAPTPHGEHLQLLITSLDHSDFLGPIGIGRIFSGNCSQGMQVIQCKDTSISQPLRITKLFTFLGLSRKEAVSAPCGDIMAVTGFDRPPTIGTTLCNVGNPQPHSYVKIDEPTLSLYLSVNDSPLVVKKVNYLTSRQFKRPFKKRELANKRCVAC